MIQPFPILILWAVVSPLLFPLLGTRRATFACFVFGWLFLPKASYVIVGLPDISPSLVIGIGVIFGILVFDLGSVLRFRPRLIDLFVVALALAPIWSSLSNELGFYNGISGSISFVMKWCVPYFCGRIMIRTVADARDLVVMILLGTIVYTPFCLWEIRLSPNLSNYVYGFSPTKFLMTRRLGGWRPMVFLHHGIELGMWISMSAFFAIALWRSRSPRLIMAIPVSFIAIGLVILTVLSRALGGWVAFAIVVSAFLGIRYLPSRKVLALFVLLPALYIAGRITNVIDGEIFLNTVSVVSEKRAHSLKIRLHHEGQLADRALERPMLGWSGWGRNRIRGEYGGDQSLTDGMWVIYFGVNGFYGLIAWLGVMLGPSFLAVRAMSTRLYSDRQWLPVLALVIAMPVITLDLIMNAFVGPSFIMISGAIASLIPVLQQASKTVGRPERSVVTRSPQSAAVR